MIWALIGCFLFNVISVVVWIMSYKLYRAYSRLHSGYVFVEVYWSSSIGSTFISNRYYGWLLRSSYTNVVNGNYRSTSDWFVELQSRENIVIKIDQIKRIREVRKPLELSFRLL